MKSALTYEEWAKGNLSGLGFQGELPLYIEGVYQPQNVIKQAAFLLEDQPFGFTLEDMLDLRKMALQEGNRTRYMNDMTFRLNDLADRIEALLPPKENSNGKASK